jgi:hypothetical protein
MYLLSLFLLYVDTVIEVHSLTCCLFILQSWSVILREGHKLRVFNTGVVRKLGPIVHEMMGWLLKLHNSFFSYLNQMFLH